MFSSKGAGSKAFIEKASKKPVNLFSWKQSKEIPQSCEENHEVKATNCANQADMKTWKSKLKPVRISRKNEEEKKPKLLTHEFSFGDFVTKGATSTDSDSEDFEDYSQVQKMIYTYEKSKRLLEDLNDKDL